MDADRTLQDRAVNGCGTVIQIDRIDPGKLEEAVDVLRPWWSEADVRT